MQSFTDGAGREWKLVIDVTALMDVQHLTGIDLGRLLMGDPVELFEMLADPLRVTSVCFALVKELADALKVSDRDFGRALAGDSVEDASRALARECAAFMPRARREAMLELLDRQDKLQVAAAARVKAEGEGFDAAAEVERLVAQKRQDAGGDR